MALLRRLGAAAALALLLLLLASCRGGDRPSQLGAANSTPTPASSPTSSATPTALPPTFTPVPTITLTPTPGPSPTASRTPTPSRTPTRTLRPTATPTSVPQHASSVVVVGTPSSVLTATPATPIPTQVQPFVVPEGVTNILLLGADNPLGSDSNRTDTIIVVSVNREAKTASMISLPRDLYVFIPNRGMGSINTAMAGGVQQLKDTIVYNFGVPIHYYARVDFAGFETVVDAIGGVDVPVSCSFEDHRLISEDLDPQEEDSWELFRVDPGLVHMDGSMALWYVRSRESTEADWGRTKRQQQMLRAIFDQGIELGLITQAPTLYETYRDTVETDLDIGRILQLASVAPAIRENGIQHLYLTPYDMAYWTLPGTERKVMLPNWERMQPIFYSLMSPSELNSGTRAPIRVEIVNGTGNPDMALLAADNLAWYGFWPEIVEADGEEQETTTITYFGSELKGTFAYLLSYVFDRREGNIELAPDVESEANFRVVLGADYDPCINRLLAPRGG